MKHIATTGSPLNYGEPRRVVTFTLEFYRDNKWKKYIVDNSVQVISKEIENSILIRGVKYSLLQRSIVRDSANFYFYFQIIYFL